MEYSITPRDLGETGLSVCGRPYGEDEPLPKEHVVAIIQWGFFRERSLSGSVRFMQEIREHRQRASA